MAIQLGNSVIFPVHQIAEVPQARAVGHILAYFAENARELSGRSLAEILDGIEGTLEREGLWSFLPARYGDLSEPRRFEGACALNRLRTLRLESRLTRMGTRGP